MIIKIWSEQNDWPESRSATYEADWAAEAEGALDLYLEDHWHEIGQDLDQNKLTMNCMEVDSQGKPLEPKLTFNVTIDWNPSFSLTKV